MRPLHTLAGLIWPKGGRIRPPRDPWWLSIIAEASRGAGRWLRRLLCLAIASTSLAAEGPVEFRFERQATQPAATTEAKAGGHKLTHAERLQRAASMAANVARELRGVDDAAADRAAKAAQELRATAEALGRKATR